MSLELTDPRPIERAEKILTPDGLAFVVSRLLDEEVERLRGEVSPGVLERYYQPAKKLISDLSLSGDFVDFIALPAYELAK